jgi:hypothetical protein
VRFFEALLQSESPPDVGKQLFPRLPAMLGQALERREGRGEARALWHPSGLGPREEGGEE